MIFEAVIFKLIIEIRDKLNNFKINPPNLLVYSFNKHYLKYCAYWLRFVASQAFLKIDQNRQRQNQETSHDLFVPALNSGGSRAIDYASGDKRKIMSRTLRIKH